MKDRAMFRGFVNRIFEAIDSDEASAQLPRAVKGLHERATDRVPRADTSRPEMSRVLVDTIGSTGYSR